MANLKQIIKRVAFLWITLTLFPLSAVAGNFLDVPPNHPHAEAINHLHQNGVIEGYENNTFRPEKAVNRAEALKIILLGSDIFVPEIQPQEVFLDVNSEAWYGKFVIKAKNLGIVKGDADTGLFRPGDTVNLAEALKILLITNHKKVTEPSDNPYTDVPANAWYAPYFEYAQGARLLDQSANEAVLPSTPITRGLLAELMYRLSQSTYIQPDGEASYYGEKFHGKTTASGAIFDASGFTAAHRTYPFGTWLKVTNAANGKSVIVEVNDRGPYAGENRIIDLSKAAFEAISPLSRGIIEVAVEVTTPPPASTENQQDGKETQPENTENTPQNTSESEFLNAVQVACPEVASLQMIDKSFFDHIELTGDIPNRVLLDEVLTLKGKLTSAQDKITAFIVDEQGVQTVFIQTANPEFTAHVRFPAAGTFKLGILPGQSGQSLIKEIKVVENNCIGETENSQLSRITGIDLSVKEGKTMVKWNKGNYDLFKLTFEQGNRYKSYLLHDLNEWTPVYRDFTAFKAGDVTLHVRGAKSDESSVLKTGEIQWSPAAKTNFRATQHEEYIVNEKEVKVLSLTPALTQSGDVIEVQFSPKASIRSQAAIILPDGKVKEIPISSNGAAAKKNIAGLEVYPASDDVLTARFTTETKGLHFLEINNDQGLAAVNIPIYVEGEQPLLPNIRDLTANNTVALTGALSDWRTQMLALVNRDRQTHGLGTVKPDDSLNQLAQSRSDDMAANNYFSHWDQQGRDANDLKGNFGIQTIVGENLARDLNLELAQYGLMRSAIHRSNILSEEWSRVGLGITKAQDGSYLVVQMFSSDPLNLSDLGSLRQKVLDQMNSERSQPLVLSDELTPLAQSWSEKMVNEEFFSFTDPQGTSLVDTVRAAGINVALGTYIVGNSSFSGALEQLKGNLQMADSRWNHLGVGIKQDKLGIINITLIYSD